MIFLTFGTSLHKQKHPTPTPTIEKKSIFSSFRGDRTMIKRPTLFAYLRPRKSTSSVLLEIIYCRCVSYFKYRTRVSAACVLMMTRASASTCDARSAYVPRTPRAYACVQCHTMGTVSFVHSFSEMSLVSCRDRFCQIQANVALYLWTA